MWHIQGVLMRSETGTNKFGLIPGADDDNDGGGGSFCGVDDK